MAAGQRPLRELTLPSIDFGELSINDALKWLIGDKIGEGQYRDVYACGFDPRMVIKFERQAQQFANVTEHQIWCELNAAKHVQKFLAPVHSISACGIWLLQARCEKLAKADRPKMVPGFLWDLKTENWGWYKGRAVCFDYSNHRLFTQLAKNGRLQKAKWWR
jgi:hypothetical protein